MTTEHETRYSLPEERQRPWSESLAERMAREQGLGQLTPAHWQVIRTLREHFIQYGALPPMRVACDINRLEPHCFDKLFRSPEEAWRIAGLPDPGEEARGYTYPGDMVQH
ncbi:MAG: TusE/DsrC/DsvC family sulfur relay protein [Pseudomonadota bacterium]